MDLHIQKVADRMGEKRGADKWQIHGLKTAIKGWYIDQGSSYEARLIGFDSAYTVCINREALR